MNMKRTAGGFVLTAMSAAIALAQTPAPQPRPMAAMMTVESQNDTIGVDGVVKTTIVSATGAFPSPFTPPPFPFPTFFLTPPFNLPARNISILHGVT